MEPRNMQFERVQFYLEYLPVLKRIEYVAYIYTLALLFGLIGCSRKRMRWVLAIEAVIILALLVAAIVSKDLTFAVVAGTAIGIMVGGTAVALLLGKFIHRE